MLKNWYEAAFRHMAVLPPPEEPKGPRYVVGLDLGQAQEYTALCVVERRDAPERDEAGRAVRDFSVRHLQRWRLGTPYTAIVADLRVLAAKDPLPGAALVVDATGVGKPVVDMIRRAGLPLHAVPVTIHGGTGVTPDDGGYRVPKVDLVGTMQALVQARRFHVVPTLPDAATLGRELQRFRVKVEAGGWGRDVRELAGAREHDDLVLSCGRLACWVRAAQDEPVVDDCLSGSVGFVRHGPAAAPPASVTPERTVVWAESCSPLVAVVAYHTYAPCGRLQRPPRQRTIPSHAR